MRDEHVLFFDLASFDVLVPTARVHCLRELRACLGDAPARGAGLVGVRLGRGLDDGLLNARLEEAFGGRYRASVLVTSQWDPRPLWELSRRYGIHLQRSACLEGSGWLIGLCRTAGVRRVEASQRIPLRIGEVAWERAPA